jgi:hypothetical protein
MDEKVFYTYWDSISKCISALLIAFITLFSVYLIIIGWNGITHVASWMWIFIILGILLPSILVMEYLLSPRRYQINDKSITIIRFGKNYQIELSSIRDIRESNRQEVFNKMTREGGSGGCFGYYGHYKNPILGRFLIYATHRDRLVIIFRHNAEPVVLSPDEVHEFIDAVKEGKNEADHIE